MIVSIKESGNKKVKITKDKYGTELYIMRNGFQWSGSPVDEEILSMILSVIEEYFSA